MTYHQITSIIWKELKAMNRVPMVAGFIFALFWAIIGAIGGTNNNAFGQTANAFVSYIPVILMLYIGNSLVMPAFYGEKMQRTIETLLASPINIRDMWLGKVIAIFVVAYAASLATCVIYLLVSLLRLGTFPDLTVFALLQLLIISPLLALALFGLMGYLYLVLLNPALVHYANLIIMIGALFGVYRALNFLVVNAVTSGIMLAIALILLSIVYYLSAKLNKERIIMAIAY